MKYLLLLCLISANAKSQTAIPKDANTIVVKGVKFLDVCNALLDAGYTIEKKDTELGTAETKIANYGKYFNATYKFHLRTKDTIAYLTATYTAPPGGGLFFNDIATNLVNKKGVRLTNRIGSYPFELLNQFALSLKKELDYLIIDKK